MEPEELGQVFAQLHGAVMTQEEKEFTHSVGMSHCPINVLHHQPGALVSGCCLV